MRFLRLLAAATAARLQMYLDDAGKESKIAAFSALTDAIDELDEEDLYLLEQAQRQDTRYAKLIQLLSGEETEVFSRAAQTLLDFAVAVFLYPELGAVLKDVTGCMVTAELAFFMEEEECPDYAQLRRLYERARMFFHTGKEAGPFFHVPFFIDDRMAGYLCGSDEPDARLRGMLQVFSPEEPLLPLAVDEALCRELAAVLPHSDRAILLSGRRGRGKRFVLCHAAKTLNRSLLIADMPSVCKRKQDIPFLLRLIRREALLRSCGVCLYGVTAQVLTAAGMDVQSFSEQVIQHFLSEGVPLCICAEDNAEFLCDFSCRVERYTMPALSRAENVCLWRQYAETYGIAIEAKELGSKYKFTPGEIAEACRAIEGGRQRGRTGEQYVAEVLRDILPPVLTRGKIEPYHSGCTFDSLVLPPEMKEKIAQICYHVLHSYRVYDEWNMESKYAYGKAVSVLLSGPPGTGKTMTARVISDMLKLPLYHINLSQLVDKYIGESEKHLEEIFANAERSNIILFFDEADAVFGKRSEVNDAKDKYANTEVSYILQRIESYDGVVILATNNVGNIDPAFLRRMKYTLNFQMPSEQERLLLWKGCFPPELPTADIDFAFLAAQFELSGSSIKDIVLTASFLAAQQNTSVGMPQLIAAVKNDYQKKGALSISVDYGKYTGYALP